MRKGCGYFLLGLLGIGIIGAYPQFSLLVGVVVLGLWALNYLDKIGSGPSKEELAKREDEKFKTGKEFEAICRDLIEKNRNGLALEKKKYIKKDSYGKQIDKGWSCLDSNVNTGINYFYNEVIQPEITKQMNNCIPEDLAPEEIDYVGINPITWAGDYCFEKVVLKSTKYENKFQWLEEVIDQTLDGIISLKIKGQKINITKELEKLGALKEKGLLTDEEFLAAKSKLLS